eukprot:gene46406-60099_t
MWGEPSCPLPRCDEADWIQSLRRMCDALRTSPGEGWYAWDTIPPAHRTPKRGQMRRGNT